MHPVPAIRSNVPWIPPHLQIPRRRPQSRAATPSHDTAAGARASAGPTTSITSGPAGTAQITPPKRVEHTNDGNGTAAEVRNNAIALMRRHSASVSLDESVSPSLVRQSMRSAQPQLFLDFISASFPTLYFHNRFRAGNEPGFAEFIIMNFGQDAYLDSAICCLSSVYLAHLTQDPALFRTSRRMYGIALSEMIRALPKGEHASSDNMLCTSMMLSVYEMYAQTSPDAWVVHSEAVKRLMSNRGTKGHKTGFGRSCWIAFRGFHVATAIYQSEPCFLDSPDWQSYASETMTEDAKKPGEWAAYTIISDKTFMEITKCPRYISETRDILSGKTPLVPSKVEQLIQRMEETAQRLHFLAAELRFCITAHTQREQGITRRPGTFVGPVPEVFPETGPSLLLRGAENIQAVLEQLHNHLDRKLRFRAVKEHSPASTVDTLSDESAETPPPAAPPTLTTFTLPFRIHSEIGDGPSKTSDSDDPRAVIWLDRVASSMGVLGTKVLIDEPPMGFIEEEASRSSPSHWS
ncbi:hypothetical protein N7468_007150 [Penicillium chermesinum]|uniref:Uncharacterized protein n=1 Tax=Penicillium chermesinum TaxID=63820 RepID=A0A9W9NTU8_9EURO|nr:uncharacterized protein N7468_007150 [Penicillium chermesinum]KAJ5225925.1 hypothetical protein N7468_007150 [Penicillium chermesinum]